MKENQQVRPVIADDFSKVTFEIRGREALVLDMGKLHPDILRRAAAVGMAQVRIVDAAAVSMTDDDGNILPEEVRIDTKRANMARLIEHYESGTAEWTLQSGGGGGNRSITIEAIAAVRGIDYEAAKAEVAKYAENGKDDKGKAFGGDTKKALAYLRKGARVAAKIDEIRAARMPKPVIDADAALNELG